MGIVFCLEVRYLGIRFNFEDFRFRGVYDVLMFWGFVGESFVVIIRLAVF